MWRAAHLPPARPQNQQRAHRQVGASVDADEQAKERNNWAGGSGLGMRGG